MREIARDSQNCFVGEIKCIHLRGRGWCELLKGNVVTISKCPGFFLSLDQLKTMDFKTIIPLLAETDPMQKLNRESAVRVAQIKVEQSAAWEELKSQEINNHYDHGNTQIPPLR